MNKPTSDEVRAAVKDVTEKLTGDGKLIEAGFAAYLIVEWGVDAATKLPNHMLVDLHRAYFSGAQHLFASINSILDEGAEPTEKDLKVMDMISTELTAFYEEMRKRHVRPDGFNRQGKAP